MKILITEKIHSTGIEELKKYHPSLEIEDAGDAIYNQDFSDIADIVVKMVNDPKGTGTVGTRTK